MDRKSEAGSSWDVPIARFVPPLELGRRSFRSQEVVDVDPTYSRFSVIKIMGYAPSTISAVILYP